MIIPSLRSAVKPVPLPQSVKDKQLDAAYAAADRNTSAKRNAPAAAVSTDTLEAGILEVRIQEVLENGGFLSLPRTRKAWRDGVDVYEYQRLSRAGQPLTGSEAKKSPRYTLTAWGTLGLTCTCPFARGGKQCKHALALTRSLTGQIGGHL